MKLYASPMSSNARRAVIVAKLTGQPLENVNEDLAKGEHLKPEYLAINPNHKVPTLVDGDLRLWESGAICQYLAALAGRTDLWPTEPRAQADVSRWMIWNHSQWAPPVAAIVSERLLKRMFGRGEPNEALVAEKLDEFRHQAALLDAHLATREWLAQGRMTLADLQLGCTLTHAHLIELPVAEFPNVKAWFDRIQALPAWRETALPAR